MISIYKHIDKLGDCLWLFPNGKHPNQSVTNEEPIKKQRPRIYQLVLIAVRPNFRIMPVPVAVLTKAAPSSQLTRINTLSYCRYV